MGTKYVAYYRVSTKMQGQSGLGLESQKSMVRNYVNCDTCLISEFTEIESGKKNNRTELLKALELCKTTGATLVIAKLDRLSRNVAFIAALMDSKINFVCVDMPNANSFTIHIFAALAEQERKMISERTKKALLEKKKVQKLGTKGTENLEKGNARKKSIEAKKQNAKENENNIKAREIARLLKNQGKTIREIVAYLTLNKHKTAKGLTNWNISQVQRLLK